MKVLYVIDRRTTGLGYVVINSEGSPVCAVCARFHRLENDAQNGKTVGVVDYLQLVITVTYWNQMLGRGVARELHLDIFHLCLRF